MAKFSETERKTIGTHVTTAKLMPNKNNVQVVCDNNQNGQAIWNMFKRVYPDYSYNKANNAWIPGAFLYGDYKTFRVLTGKKEKAQELLDEINSCIEQYGNAALDNTFGLTGGGSGGGGNTYVYNTYQQTEDDGGKEGIFSGSSTYIILGAAAIIIVLLLFGGKKK